MKILCITRTVGNRGGHVIFAQLIRALKSQGYVIDFVAFKPDGTDDFSNCESLYEGLDAKVIAVPASENDATQMDAYLAASVKFLKAYQHTYDKIILDSWLTAAAGIIARVEYGKSYQLVQSDPLFAPEDESVIWKSRYFELLPLYPMQRVVVSQSIQTLFEQRYHTVHPRIDLSIDDAYRTADFTVQDGPVMRFVSSASDFNIPSKGLDFLLQSLKEFDKPCSLTLISGKPIHKDLAGYPFAVTEKTAETVDQMIQILQAHDAYVNTSTRESFGLALAEAITLGMPAIALDSVGNRDYNRGDNFIFVEDKSHFNEQLVQICKREVRERLHNNARSSMDAYKLSVMVDHFKSAIKI
ncbi:MAG: glycosyltransferase [Candidatus Saccharibacteria bacterium]